MGLTAFGLHTSLSDYWVVDEDRADRLFLTFDAFDGQSYTGIAHKGYTIDPFARATGTISPNRDVRIALSTGVEYRGTRRWNVNNGRHALLMTLTQSGGPENGSTFTMRLDSPY